LILLLISSWFLCLLSSYTGLYVCHGRLLILAKLTKSSFWMNLVHKDLESEWWQNRESFFTITICIQWSIKDLHSSKQFVSHGTFTRIGILCSSFLALCFTVYSICGMFMKEWWDWLVKWIWRSVISTMYNMTTRLKVKSSKEPTEKH